jgi:CheY-like chemotaxis protein
MEKHKNPVFNFVIADDDPDDQLCLQKVIWHTNVHHKITSVYNGLQLLEYLQSKGTYKNCKENRPDCIFLDLNMPLLSGNEALLNIRQHKELTGLPVFILTTSNCIQERDHLLKLGANGFYTKTHDIKNWRVIVKEVIKQLSLQTSSPGLQSF